MKRLRYGILMLVAILGFVLPSTADDTGPALEEYASVEDAVARITSMLEDRGFEIPLVVNHGAAAESVDLKLRPTQVIFARPHPLIEHFLLKRSDTVGIDLPIKILVFENDVGKVETLSNPAGYLIDRHGIKVRDFVLHWLQTKSEKLGGFPDGLNTLPSQLTFDETVERLVSAIPTPPFRIPLKLDYADHRTRRYAPAHPKRIRPPFLVVFGNPLAGTPLMQADQRIGLDLPQEFLVWQDPDGGVNITWNDPFFIADRYDIEGQDARLEAIAKALRNFAGKGAGE